MPPPDQDASMPDVATVNGQITCGLGHASNGILEQWSGASVDVVPGVHGDARPSAPG